MSLLRVLNEYQIDPAFHRLRRSGADFVVPGGRLDAPVLVVADVPASAYGLASLLLATDFRLDDCYVTSVVKYDADLPSSPAEIRDSRAYLRREMRSLSPKVIVALGPQALGSFVKDAPPWNMARGRLFQTSGGTPVVGVVYATDFHVALNCLETKEFKPRG